MGSPAAASIASTLQDLDSLFNSPRRRILKDRGFVKKLKRLKMFVLMSTRKWDNPLDDANLPSFLPRIEDVVHKLTETFHSDGEPSDLDNSATDELLSGIESFLDEMDERYFTLRDSLLLQLSGSLVTVDEISIILSSISEDLEEFPYEEVTEDMLEQVKFLQTLVCFVGKPTQELLAHAKNVAIHLHLLVMCPAALHGLGAETLEEESIQDLLLTIKPIDPLVSETYIQALTTSKLVRQLPAPADHQHIDDGAFIATKNFLDSLIHNLWELLRLNTVRILSVKHHIPVLYHTFRSLRAILKQQQPPNIIKEHIVSLVYDAGVLIISLYQTHVEVDLGYFHDLLKTTRTILLQLGEKEPSIQAFNFPKTNQLGFVDFVLEKLVDLINWEAEPTANIMHVQTIHEELVSLRSFLGDFVEIYQKYEELQDLWNCVLEVAYKAECLIDYLLAGDILISSSTFVDAIMKDVRDIRLKIEVLRPEIEVKIQQNQLKEAARSYNHMPSQTISLETKNEVVGFANDAKLIMDRLKRGVKQLKVIAIVGMPGIGKTTLATKVYNDSSILFHFEVRAWCPISQALDKRNVLFKLLEQVDPDCKCSEHNEQDLVEKLWRELKRKRYLIYLDDVWNIEAWNSLAQAFPDDNYGSRIILTSRHQGIVPSHMLDQEPHFLQPLNKDESWELFQRKLFPGNDGLDPALRDLVMQIVAYCKGLPLTIILIAGILTNTKPEDWVKIWKNLSLGDASVTAHCMNSLELSYKSLPDKIKPCLLYFGTFPEDAEIPTERLLYLWIAEGFVSKVEGKRIKDVAEGYLNDLIERNLIIISQKRWNGRVKTCQIHDLLLDYCLQKAKDEHFLHLVKGYDELSTFNEPCSLRRLCIQSKLKHFKQSKLFCPRARSLFFQDPHRRLYEPKTSPNASFVISIFKLLRVLNLEEIRLTCGFPSEISLLVQLAFLAIQGYFRRIPSSIAKLSNLETLIVNPCAGWISLPDSMWSLRKLKYLRIITGHGNMPIETLDKLPILYELDVLSGAHIILHDCSLERLMAKFPNIRKFKCYLDGKFKSSLHVAIKVPDFLRQLESVHLLGNYLHDITKVFNFSFPENLKKLKLRCFHLSWDSMSIIGKLPNLQVFELIQTKFEGDTWEMKEGEFSQLRILKLEQVQIVKWRACDNQFECLHKLDLRCCQSLKEMPCYCLENLATLETIVAFFCFATTNKLVKRIKEQQKLWGNTNLKVYSF